MSRRKRTIMIASLAVGVFLLAAAVAYAAGMFPDVASTDTHYDAIEWAAENGIVNGYADGTFGPYDNIKRGQAATMFKNYDDYLQSTMDGSSSCADCHNASTLLTGKQALYGLSVHGAGVEDESAFELAYAEGTRNSCTGCHSGNGFSDRIAAGQDPTEVTAGQTDPTRVDCRACHEVHETYTGADWALETEAPVEFYALPGKTFDGGAGNLCANCHQPRVSFPAAVDGMVTFTSSRFGPHHGPQSATLASTGGAGPDGAPFFHYTIVPDTCITCHMGANDNHTFEPNLENCVTCHGTDIDAIEEKLDTLQAEVQAMLDELGAKLLAAGMITDTNAAVPGTYTEAKAAALWNYRDFLLEDKSLGAHNPPYVKALLTAGIAAFE